MYKFIVLALLAAAANCQEGGSSPAKIGLGKLEALGKGIKEEAMAVETALATRLQALEKVTKNSMKIGQDGVKGIYDRALEQLDAAPKDCVNGIKNNVLQLQADADRTFLSCSNLTLAVHDLGNLVTYTGTMLLGLARSVQELTWFTNCFSWNPIKSLPCFFEWIGLIFQGTRGLISSLSNFNSELDSTLLHMLKVIEYCQARTTGQHDIVAVMTPVHQCARQPVPYHLYTVQNRLN